MSDLSLSKVATVIQGAPELIRRQQAVIRDQREKLARYEKQERVDELVRQIESKGLMADLDHSEKVANLMERTDLETIEEAVKMSAPRLNLAGLDTSDRVPGAIGASETRADQELIDNVLSMEL